MFAECVEWINTNLTYNNFNNKVYYLDNKPYLNGALQDTVTKRNSVSYYQQSSPTQLAVGEGRWLLDSGIAH